MIDMNIKSNSMDCCTADYNNCPTIYLTDEQCAALGITTAPAAGTTYMLNCKATAIRVTAESDEGDGSDGEGPDVCLTLRITEMELSGAEQKSIASVLYGD